MRAAQAGEKAIKKLAEIDPVCVRLMTQQRLSITKAFQSATRWTPMHGLVAAHRPRLG